MLNADSANIFEIPMFNNAQIIAFITFLEMSKSHFLVK